MSDLETLLRRAFIVSGSDEGGVYLGDMSARAALAELAAKDAEIAGLRRALGPLARIDCLIDENDPSRGYAFDAWLDGQVVFGIGKERVITAGDLRRARAALNGNGDQTRSE